MSRIGKQPITVPAGVEVTIDGNTVTAKGPKGELTRSFPSLMTITREGGKKEDITLLCRIDTYDELDYMKNGGILHYVLRQLIAS